MGLFMFLVVTQIVIRKYGLEHYLIMICIFMLLLFRYFCKADSTSKNYVPEMEACGLWQDIIAAKNLVAFSRRQPYL